MTVKTPFGKAMRDTHFSFSPDYTPLNHGSFGAIPKPVQAHQHALQKLAAERPDTFIVYDLPQLMDESRAAIAPYLGVDVDEVVFVPNATTAVNVVLRNLKYEEGDVVIHFSTVYSACEKTINTTSGSVGDNFPVEKVCVELEFPVEDEVIVESLKKAIKETRARMKRVRLCMFDTVLTFPGVKMPWEKLVQACKEMHIFSLVDGAHGIGHVDLSHMGKVSPDFFVSNCHKWLYTPRGCAVFHVPKRNQRLIRTSLPTSHGYQYPTSSDLIQTHKTPFIHLFEFVATIDYTPYLCVPAALSFRAKVCGGEADIRDYCFTLAREGGERVASILGTEMIAHASETSGDTCFANVGLPFDFGNGRFKNAGGKVLNVDDALRISKWLNREGIKKFDTYLQIGFHAGVMWVRLSAQVYLEMKDFEWVGEKLKELCHMVEAGAAD